MTPTLRFPQLCPKSDLRLFWPLSQGLFPTATRGRVQRPALVNAFKTQALEQKRSIASLDPSAMIGNSNEDGPRTLCAEAQGLAPMNRHFLDYYRCPDIYANFQTSGPLSQDSGYFQWGRDTVCYGRTASGARAHQADSILYDAQGDAEIREAQTFLPFDPQEVIENLQRERYSAHFRQPGRFTHTILRKAYYLLRPYMSVSIRKHLQRINLRNWDKIPFPKWPIDSTVDRIHRKLMAHAMQANGVDKIPFIWFWPDNYKGCAIITHDVESHAGRDFCRSVMDMDESFGFRSSFQIVPEDRYSVTSDYLDLILNRGFEINVHDLKHDGRLYAEYNEFIRRAQRINQYGREFGASGFRSGILYRNADWYGAFEFLYDMSIPNVAHLDPQRGGCCTVMPYFIGKIIEVPVTCTQDYTLFHILQDYSIDLWKRQIDLIMANHGLVSILVHPDYIIESRAQSIYKRLLGYLSEVRDAGQVWTPLPREVAEWWQQRNRMELVCEDGLLRINGPGKERARIAYACAEGEDITYRLEGERASVAS